jgi:hypothetical protein
MPEKSSHKDIPLSGKLVTRDPASIGSNFQTLNNLRYTPTHKKGVGGMTKINSVAAHATAEIGNLSHFIKTNPAETHLLAHLNNGTVLENTTAIPTAGNFSGTVLWTDSSGAGDGRFSNVSDGQVVYSNSVDTCIWGGDEMRCGAFITSTADINAYCTNPRDYSTVVTNTKQDGENIVFIGGGIDSNVKLMLHCNGADASTTFTDESPTTPLTVTARGDAQIDTSQSVFGAASCLLDGTSDYLEINDDADLYFGTSQLCLEFRVRFAALPAAGYATVIYSQYADSANWTAFYLRNLGGSYYLSLVTNTAGTVATPLNMKQWTTPVVNTWYHLAVIRGWGGNANVWAVTVNGTSLGSTTLSTTYPNVGGNAFIGTGNQECLTGQPAAQSATYVKSTSAWDANYVPYNATNPAKSLTGAMLGNSWLATSGTVTNQRFHIDMGTARIVTRIYYENLHNLGGETDSGAKNFTFWGSNEASAFAELTYATDTNWTQLTTSQGTFDQHSGSDAGDPKYITVTNTTAYRYYAFKFADNYGHATYFGVRRIELQEAITANFNGWLDEIRFNVGVSRWTANYAVPTIPYSSAANYWVVGSPRPLKGVKFYIATGAANVETSTLSISEWNGSSWNDLTATATDNTAVGGVTLAQTGTVTWPSTVDSASSKHMEGYLLYWYKFSISTGSAHFYHCTMDAPFQPIVDVWDGVDRSISRFFYYFAGSYHDYTMTVREDEYSSADTGTYCYINSLATGTESLVIGFTEIMTGINFAMIPNYTNSTADTVMSVYYWNGSDWVTVGTVSDGTAESGISLAKSGTVSWDHSALGNEFSKVIAASASPLSYTDLMLGTRAKYSVPPLYYYKVCWDKTLDSTCGIYYVSGIPAAKTIGSFKFPLFAQGRVLLCADMAGDHNKILCGAKYLPDVYNGEDSVEVYFGDERELTCGTELFSQFGASLFSLVLMFKDNETWMMAGQDINEWSKNTFMLSSSIGCPAPLTLKTINLAQEPGTGINRALAIWQGTNGIYMSDGRAPIPIHLDIQEYFDRKDSRCIKSSEIGKSSAFIDPINHEYHWIFASGTAGTKKELVYSINNNGWYEMDRGAGKALRCGCTAVATDGNPYNYAAINGGYIERLEYGTDFDGNDITHQFRTGDMALADTVTAETMIDKLKLVAVAKSTTTNTVSATHYGDGCATGTALKTFSPAKSNHRITVPYITDNLGGHIFHSLDFSMTTNNETIGFEPLCIGLTFHKMRQD